MLEGVRPIVHSRNNLASKKRCKYLKESQGLRTISETFSGTFQDSQTLSLLLSLGGFYLLSLYLC